MSVVLAWIWAATDYAESPPTSESFAIRFKTAEIADDFKKAFDLAREKNSKGSADGSKVDSKAKADSKSKAATSSSTAASTAADVKTSTPKTDSRRFFWLFCQLVFF